MQYCRSACLFAIILFFTLPAVSALGVGLRWTTQGELVGFGETKCIPYGVYNPFGTDTKIRLETTGNLSDIVTEVIPPDAFVPAGTMATDALRVDLCLYGKRGKFPFKPANYEGEVLAVIIGTQKGGTGSAVGASIAAPLVVKVGNYNLYNNIKKGSIALGALLILGISYVSISRYKRKKWESTIRNECPTCKKTYPYEAKFCPDDGTSLVKYKGDERLEE